jgi:hypothetical protein
VVEIAFDEVFGDDTFVFTPPPGVTVRSILDDLPVRPDLTIEQAVVLAPFTVWIPARAPAGWEAQIGFATEQDRPPMPPQLHLHYRAPSGTEGFSLAESPADHPGEQGGYEHAQTVRLELDGTRIVIHSTSLGADALEEVAAGLVRAP